VVKHLPHHHKIGVLSPAAAAGIGVEKMVENKSFVTLPLSTNIFLFSLECHHKESAIEIIFQFFNDPFHKNFFQLKLSLSRIQLQHLDSNP
jgi:hypothetical protein